MKKYFLSYMAGDNVLMFYLFITFKIKIGVSDVYY